MGDNLDWAMIGLGLSLFLISLLSINLGVIFLKRAKKAGQIVRQQVLTYEELFRGTQLSWIGRLYVNIFTPRVVKISVLLAAFSSILFGCTMAIAAIIGVLAALFVK